jgi:adenine phosphoribosyltransferase
MSLLADSLRSATVLPRGAYAYLVHPLLDGVPRCPPDLLKEWVQWARLTGLPEAATVLLAPEAMGLPLAAALSVATGLPYAIARKRAYGLPGERAVPAKTGYGEGVLHLNGLRAALLDAIRATGAVPVGALVVVDKGTARKAVARRFNVPVLAAATVSVTAKGVEVLDG